MKRFRHWVKAFTLIELLVAVSVLTILLVILLGMTQSVSTLWQRSEGQKNRQQTARAALAAISKDLESGVFSFSTNGDKRLRWLLNPGFAGLENPDAAFWVTAGHAGEDGSDSGEVGYFVRWTTNANRVTPELCRFFIPGSGPDSVFQSSTRALDAALVNEKAPGSDDPQNLQRGLAAQNVAGLWIDLFESDGTLIPGDYDSDLDPERPGFAEVALLVLDPATAKRLTGASTVTSLYSGSPDDAALKLQQDHGISAQVFRQRVPLRAAPPSTPPSNSAP